MECIEELRGDTLLGSGLTGAGLDEAHGRAPLLGGWADDCVSSGCYRIVPRSGCAAERAVLCGLRKLELPLTRRDSVKLQCKRLGCVSRTAVRLYRGDGLVITLVADATR